MKAFTCKEIMDHKGGCDMVFEGDDMMAVAGQCGQHVGASTDDAHKPMRDMMSSPDHNSEEQAKWFEWFKGEWDKKQNN